MLHRHHAGGARAREQVEHRTRPVFAEVEDCIFQALPSVYTFQKRG